MKTCHTYVDIEVLGNATPSVAQRAKGHAFVQKESQLVLLAQLHQFRQRAQLARINVNSLGHKEATCLLRLFWILLIPFVLLHEQLFQVLDVIVLEVDNGATRGIQTFLYSKVDALIAATVLRD